jgi:hypothetical protein
MDAIMYPDPAAAGQAACTRETIMTGSCAGLKSGTKL